MADLLVTGGAGFMGSGFVRYVLARTPHRVTVLDRLTYAANPASLDDLPTDRFELVRGDVADAATVDPLVARHDVVVHFAAESHNDASLSEPAVFVHSNVVGTFTLLEAVRRHDVRLHHVSTDEVYGDLAYGDPGAFTESSAMRPSSPYSATKAGSDLLVGAWIRSYGLRATITNSTNNYGPRQHLEKFIPRQITRLLRGDRPRLYGDGRNERDWLHVDDHSAAVLAVVERGRIGSTYAVGSGLQRSNLEVVQELLAAFDRPADEYDHVNDRPGHDRRYAVDAGRITDELSWRPAHTDFFAGLQKTIAWYGDHRPWWEPQVAAAEESSRQRGQ